jgi:phosphate:Na+ symporter
VIAQLAGGLGLFFIGVRSLSVSLVPLIGRRSRARFARALRGPVSGAVSGVLAGMLTQSSTAVSWIILGLIRTGMRQTAWLLLAPAWSNVGTALLPVLVAVNFTTAASYVIFLVGFAIYFRLDNTDRRRHLTGAVMGAALLLLGMQIFSAGMAPFRGVLDGDPTAALAFRAPGVLALIGVGFSIVTQSSSVAVAIAVAGIHDRLLTVVAALPLIAGANAAGIVNNILKSRGETEEGRIIFALQILQKAAGTLLLAGAALLAACHPEDAKALENLAPFSLSGQIAGVFMLAQLAGAIAANLTIVPLRALIAWARPAGTEESLSRPVFLLREALEDPPAALDLTMRELARLCARLPQMLDKVRANPDPKTPPMAVLRDAGLALAAAIKIYLLALLDGQPGRAQVATALLLENAAGNVIALHETLSELAAAIPAAAMLPSSGRLVEAMHFLLGFVADHAASLGAEDPEFVLKLLTDRNGMMSELRQKLTAESENEGLGQDALFRMTILFERAVWLARRLVTDLAQACQAQQAE